MSDRADDLNEKQEDVPQPGTREPKETPDKSGDPTKEPGDVTVDEPTEPSLRPVEDED